MASWGGIAATVDVVMGAVGPAAAVIVIVVDVARDAEDDISGVGSSQSRGRLDPLLVLGLFLSLLFFFVAEGDRSVVDWLSLSSSSLLPMMIGGADADRCFSLSLDNSSIVRSSSASLAFAGDPTVADTASRST